MNDSLKSSKPHKKRLISDEVDSNKNLKRESFEPTLHFEFNNSKMLKIKRKNSEIDVEEKSSQFLKSNPLELMNRLEEFSDVWNDFPDVKTTAYVSNNLHENNELFENHLRKGHLKVNNDRTTSYKQAKDNCQLSVNGIKTNIDDNILPKYVNKKQSKLNPSFEKLGEGGNVEDSRFSMPDVGARHYQGQDNSEKTNSELADLKRKKAVKEHRQLYVDQKKIIKQALSALDGRKVNKKVVFSDNNDFEKNEQRKKKDVALKGNDATERPQLFEEVDEDSEMETNFKQNPQFEGKKGQKLLELQSKYASDSRFTLDTRFYESGSEASEHEIQENKNHIDEKEKQLAILGSIVKRQINPLSEIKKRTKQPEFRWMVRFDPTREDHSKYLLKPNDAVSVENKSNKKPEKKKNKDDKKRRNEKKDENKTKVSDEKFYSVKEDLKVALKTQNKTEFSLLKLFGPKETLDSNIKAEGNQKLKKLKYSTKNPFKYDSSESEPEEEETPTMKERENKSSIAQPAATTWRTTFFLTENDTRLQEAMEFFKSPVEPEDDQEFAEKRKILKNFMQNKFKNSHRKNGLFKKKLGGLKRNPVFKKKAKKS